MTNQKIQEQIEKIIKDKVSNLPIKGDFDATRVLYLNEGAIRGLSQAFTTWLLERVPEDKKKDCDFRLHYQCCGCELDRGHNACRQQLLKNLEGE